MHLVGMHGAHKFDAGRASESSMASSCLPMRRIKESTKRKTEREREPE